jgi:hypothetical protein
MTLQLRTRPLPPQELGMAAIAILRPRLAATALAASQQRRQRKQITPHPSSTSIACRDAELRAKMDHPKAQHPSLPFSRLPR